MSDAGATSGDPQPPRSLLLASTSVYRRQLLERLGLPFRWRAPACDEAALASARTGLQPRELAAELAWAKASSLLGLEPDVTIIGCDQLVSFGNQIFGKPLTARRAAEQLELMSGQTHELVTALVVIDGSRIMRHTDITTLSMRSLTHDAIDRYIAADSPLDCAGSYKLESAGIALFDRIETADHTAITGLPLIALVSILRDLGYQIP
jgi:septum formation protein